MARHQFGLSSADLALERLEDELRVRPGSVGTVWDAYIGGSQLTDLQNLGLSSVTEVIADSDGRVGFWGPDEVFLVYVDFGWGRFAMSAIDLGDILSNAIERITTLEAPISVNIQTGASYTLALADAENRVERNNASAHTTTVPPNSSVPFPLETTILLRNYGTGAMSIVAGSGVTIRSRGGSLSLAGQYSSALLTKRGTDEWMLDGDLT